MTSTRSGRAGGGVDVARRWARRVCWLFASPGRLQQGPVRGSDYDNAICLVRPDRSAQRAARKPAEREPLKASGTHSTANFAVTLPSTPRGPEDEETRTVTDAGIPKWRTYES